MIIKMIVGEIAVACYQYMSHKLGLKKQFYDTFLWMGFNSLKARATSRRQFTFVKILTIIHELYTTMFHDQKFQVSSCISN